MVSDLHIVHYIDSLGIGGGQSMLFELYHGLNKYYPSLKQQIWLANARCISSEFVASYGISYSVVKTSQFEQMVRSMNVPVIVLYHKLMCSKTEFYRHLRRNVPVIVVNHTFIKNPHLNRIEPADIVICVSEYMKKMLRRKLPDQRMAIIRNGVDQERFAGVSSRVRPYEGVLLTGRINALNSIKYSRAWLEWCCDVELPKKMVHEYIGTGMHHKKAEAYLQKRREKPPRNDICLLGRIHDFQEKISILKSWDVFLYEVNRDEGISIAILESLACGVPVVCSNHYGNKEIIENGVNGYVFKDRKEAKQILSRLCSRPDELDALKTSTLKHFKEKLDIRYVVDAYVGKISDIAQRRKINISIAPRKKEAQEIIVKQDKKKFTILTAARDVKPYLDDWSRSIFAQEYRPLEVVFVDDCSRDGTFDKVLGMYKRFQAEKIELKLVQNEKRLCCGTSYAKAWENSTGYYYGVLDGDDMLKEDAVDYIVGLYEKYPDITYIYTQFEKCDVNMKRTGKGFCCVPKDGQSLLDLGEQRIHAFSHWRTFSKRHTNLNKIWGRGLRAGIDKYMGYRLEEFGKGMFTNRICYKYRWARPGCISKTEKAIEIWKEIVRDAKMRRKRDNITYHKIKTI